ncbi:hypothetical protein [Natrinema sp. H-ect4]|uniref:hypothetical protein n=1 Tax=Natrinema sp. H-ect4 TaxID=3242699 RepID=UPI0035A9A955
MIVSIDDDYLIRPEQALAADDDEAIILGAVNSSETGEFRPNTGGHTGPLETAAGLTFSVLNCVRRDALPADPTLLAVIITDRFPGHWIYRGVIRTQSFVSDTTRLEVALAVEFRVIIGVRVRLLAVIAGE